MPRPPLNPYALARYLGGVFQDGGTQPVFGDLGKLQVAASALANRPAIVPDVEFSDSDDEVLRKCFEHMRDGLAVDRFLADPVLARRFTGACREVGLTKAPAAINRRLLRLRKKAGGGPFKRTTRIPRHPGLLDRLGMGVEYAAVRIRMRNGASVDDILADVEIGEEFERLAREISPGGSPVEYRVCALQIRKDRPLTTEEQSLFHEVNSKEIEEELVPIGPLDHVAVDDAPPEAGILMVLAPSASLFVNRFSDLHVAAQRVADPAFGDGLARTLRTWQPSLAETQVQFVTATDLPGPISLWHKRLLVDLMPLFNWSPTLKLAG